MNALNAQGWGNRGYLISAGFQLMKISSLALCMDKQTLPKIWELTKVLIKHCKRIYNYTMEIIVWLLIEINEASWSLDDIIRKIYNFAYNKIN